MAKPDIRVIDKDMGYEALSKTLADLGTHESKAGLIRGKAPQEVIEYGAKNHFGTQRIPARPWATQKWDAGNHETYGDEILEWIDAYLDDGDVSKVKKGFERAAAMAAQDQREAIKGGKFASNDESTIALKGNNRPLIESGTLLKTIDASAEVSDEPFKPADDYTSVARVFLAQGGGRSKKRKRRVSLRRKISGLSALAKSPGYEGRGIRKSPAKRGKAAAGVASRGTRRRGLRF